MGDYDKFCLNKHIKGCYCSCHDFLSSRPACEHCSGDSETALDYQSRLRELLLSIGDAEHVRQKAESNALPN